MSDNLHHSTVLLILQLSFIIIIAWVGNLISSKIKIPEVILYLLMGIFFGPYLLGSMPLSGMLPEGLFPLYPGSEPVSQSLFAFATIASVILLFSSGLQSDIELFKKYAIKGTVVGLSAVILSFLGGYMISVLFLSSYPLIHPVHLFLGTITTATSVGITSSVLADNKMISSPEGITILSAAVLDDVIGVILLSIVISISSLLLGQNTGADANLIRTIVFTALKAIFIWLFFTIAGILCSRQLGELLKKAKDTTIITLIALALSFLLGFVFEYYNLSVIVGAYIVGLTLSNTDISYVIQERMYPIYKFFIPIFFFVSGMYINIQVIFQLDILLFGLSFSLVGILAKFFGASVPAFFTGFNLMGATRIGAGMLPRGEVSLIIAGLGRGFGILDDRIFSATLVMIFISSVLAPILLDFLLKSKKKGTRKDLLDTTISTSFEFERIKLTKFILSEVIRLFQADGFFINSTRRKSNTVIYIRKKNTFITLHYRERNVIFFDSEESDQPIIRTAVYEAVSSIAETTHLIQRTLNPKKILPESKSARETGKKNAAMQLGRFLRLDQIAFRLKSETKNEMLHELLSYLKTDKDFTEEDRKAFSDDLFERERALSTGLENGVAIPHARSAAVKSIKLVLGLKPEGIDFDAFDKKHCNIFVLIASPLEGPHLEVLSKISTLLNNEDFRKRVLQANNSEEILTLFSQ